MTVTPFLLSDNLFSTALYPDHAVAASDDSPDHEAFRVGNGRRDINDCHIPSTANAAVTVGVTMDRIRGATCLIIDRGFNYTGATVLGRMWSDLAGSSSITEYLNCTIPTVSAPGTPDDPNGVLTEEGAWIKRFPFVSGLAADLYIPALGVGVKPQTVGLYLGMSWAPTGLDYPWAEDDDELIVSDFTSDFGWVGSSRVANRRSGTLNVRLSTSVDYDLARLYVHGFYGRRSPMWICYDDQQADRTVCAIRPQGTLGFRHDINWIAGRRAEIPWLEHEPLA